MIAEKSLQPEEILRISRNATRTYCINRGYPIIPVQFAKPRLLREKQFAVFSDKIISILINPNACSRLSKELPYNRVWWLNNYIVHELIHYKQFLEKRAFDEEEATFAGNLYADKMIKTYSPEVINPIIETIGYGLGLGMGFAVAHKAIDKVWKNPFPKETIHRIFRVSDGKLVFAGNSKDATKEFKRLGGIRAGYRRFYTMSETMPKNPIPQIVLKKGTLRDGCRKIIKSGERVANRSGRILCLKCDKKKPAPFMAVYSEGTLLPSIYEALGKRRIQCGDILRIVLPIRK